MSSGRGSRTALAVFFVGAGVNHFVIPGTYKQIVPPGLGDPATLVRISGAAEIAGGVGVLLPRTRGLAGLGLIALLAAVFPANVYMALNSAKFAKIPVWALYARLPLQPLMMWWAWRASRPSMEPLGPLRGAAGPELPSSGRARLRSLLRGVRG